MTRQVNIGCDFIHQSRFNVSAVFQVEPLRDQPAELVEEHWTMDPPSSTGRTPTSTATPAVG